MTSDTMIPLTNENFKKFEEVVCEVNEDTNIIKMCMEEAVRNGNLDVAMVFAAMSGDENAIKICKEQGATKFDAAMVLAALWGRENIVKLCMECGATEYNWAMACASGQGHESIVKLLRNGIN